MPSASAAGELISQARCRTDPIDARKLAELTRANLLPTIWAPPPEVQAWRQLVRGPAMGRRERRPPLGHSAP